MILRPLRKCNYSLCNELTRNENGFCDKHLHLYIERQQEEHKRRELFRGSRSARGYDWQWQKVRKTKMSINPVCERCKVKLAECVHHIQPISQNRVLRLRYDNLMSLCQECHQAIHRELSDTVPGR